VIPAVATATPEVAAAISAAAAAISAAAAAISAAAAAISAAAAAISAAAKQRKKGFVRRKVCRFCADSSLPIDYRDAKTLRLFVSETGKMIPRRISGNCARHQRPLALAIKRARHLALLPTSANYL
jgi:small subunit ribosomal protein S18